MADGKAFYLDATVPGILKSFDPIRRKYEIKVKGSIFELHEVFASFNFARLYICEVESQFSQSSDERAPIFQAAIDEQVCILGRIWEPEQDRAGFADKQIADVMRFNASRISSA